MHIPVKRPNVFFSSVLQDESDRGLDGFGCVASEAELEHAATNLDVWRRGELVQLVHLLEEARRDDFVLKKTNAAS